MSLDSSFHTLGLVAQIFLLDLILSGDNAVVIALVCRSLPSAQMHRAIVLGTGAAILLRVVLASLVGVLFLVPYLKLAGALLLVVIAIRLLIEEAQPQPDELQAAANLRAAVVAIIGADLVMSMDNVAALAAVAQGSPLVLAMGVLFSVPLLMYGSRLMAVLLQRHPLLIPACGALLGYIAGDIATTDPAVANWVDTQSPALHVVVPWLCAVFVVVESRIIMRRRQLLPRPRAVHSAVPSMVAAPAPAALALPVMARSAAVIPVLPSSMAAHPEAVSAANASDAAPTPSMVPKPPAAEPLSAATSSPEQESRVIAAVKRLGPILLGVLMLSAFVLAAYMLSHMRRPAADTQNPAAPAAADTAAPSALDFAYACTGSDATVYYHHGASTIRIVTAGASISGHVDATNRITWTGTSADIARLHFTPPDKVENDARSVRLTGGSFADMRCVRKP